MVAREKNECLKTLTADTVKTATVDIFDSQKIVQYYSETDSLRRVYS